MIRLKKKSSQLIIGLEAVKKVYHVGTVDVHALNGASLMIKEGEFVAIMGPSGSGKSTLMNMVGCLDVPSSGIVRLGKHDIAQMSESRLAQVRGKKIGFVFQQFNLIPTLTALENVMMPMMFQGMSREGRKKRGEELLAQLGMQERMHHKPTELSGGQQQRVAIARSLANDPDVILADEPTGNLDSQTAKVVMEILTKLHKAGKTIIIVTHEQDIAKYAQRTINIKDGVIIT